jgi:medium-chain acyl-[acyl-carrier-protein] hydrolase
VSTGRVPRWFLSLRGAGTVHHRFFCFPYAGAGASVYRRLTRTVPPNVEICVAQLPGREDRLGEPPIVRLSDLIPLLVREMQPLTDVPFSLFGHSMGALIAFELTRELARRQLPMPAQVFVSGRRAPHLSGTRRALHALPSAELYEELRGLQGTPQAVLDDPELMALVEPALRGDFEVCETYVYAGGDPLDVPLSVFGGADDPEASQEELDAWRAHSTRFLGVRVLPGNHFYLHDEWETLLRAMLDGLSPDAR